MAGRLPALPGKLNGEPRGAIWTVVNINGVNVQLINTHLGLRKREQINQAISLMGPDWLGHPACAGPAILCGDFNCLPGSAPYRCITHSLRDTQKELENHRVQSTWFSHVPVGRIDHVLCRSGI